MGGSTLLRWSLVSFLVGLGFAGFFPSISGVFVVVALLLVVFIVFAREHLRAAFLWGALLLVGFFFFREMLLRWDTLPATQDFSGSVRIVSVDEPKVFYRLVTLKPMVCEKNCSSNLIQYLAPLSFESTPGDIYELQCALSRPENFDPHFDYRHFLAARNVAYVCKKATNINFESSPQFSFSRSLFTLREFVIAKIRLALPEPAAGLAIGLILGGDSALSKEMQTAFARTGLSHIVAVSGYNIALLVQLFLIAGLAAGLWRKHALIVALISMLLFLFLIGAPASAVRAVIMTGVGFGAFFFHRLTASWNALLLAASGMLIVNPLLLPYDAGFQLSFLATLALLAGSPLVERFLPLEKWWGKTLALMLFTFIIELFTLPVLLMNFGQATWLAPLTNLLVLPLVPIAMLLLLALLPCILFLPSLATLVVFPLWLVLTAQISLVQFFSSLPFGLVVTRPDTYWWIFGWYGMVGIAWYYFAHKKYALELAK